LRQLLKGCEKVAFVGIGGGGDVCSAAALALAAEREGLASRIATVVWERFSRDPVPGPIPLDELKGALRLSAHLAACEGGCHATRGGKLVVPHASIASKALKRPVYVVDVAAGAVGVAEGLAELARLEGLDCVVGVDVGGDVLAEGHESDLWSPLADSVGLAALASLAKRGLKAFLAVHSPGADGELGSEYVLSRLALVAKRGGYIGARGLCKDDVEVLEALLERADSEASRVQLLAVRGEFGPVLLRGGTRVVQVSLLQTITFFVDASVAFEVSPLAKAVSGTASLEEARKRLNEMGVLTELDLERLVYDFSLEAGRPPTPDELIALKKRGLEKLKEAGAVS